MITQDLFLKALNNNKAVRPQDMELLTTWFALPGRAVSAEQVVAVTGAKRASLIVNNLGKRVAAFLEVDAGTGASVVALDEKNEAGEAVWVMREELSQALLTHGSVAAEAVQEEVAPVVKAEPVKAEVKAAPVVSESEVVVEVVDSPLAKALVEFDVQFIRKAYPNTPAGQRLLKPAMVNALVTTRPVNARAYQRKIPAELRKSVNTQEVKMFLNKVLGILKAH
ncbi:hypothetical protein [Endozoicomonas numazuensis]|uniref:Uncharacterized protein n=1 Tax=Endozoicomonas numazuensis TaxID=1137799 RepID=A0A081NJE1_9GAMM|nr:hypothetical protein [Endozoicomonas numazuensis]KEQ18564.1 hypothetical protein GZ78_13995 [Endozoicomonas numazuensis]